MLMWHRRLHLIDHGAALYFHHSWDQGTDASQNPFALIKDHVLLGQAGLIREVDPQMKALLHKDAIAALVRRVPDEWLPEDAGFSSRDAQRDAYVRFLVARLASSTLFVEEAINARSAHV